jgi:hypothetical protein
MTTARFTAHDVRKLRVCAICDGIGHLDQMLTLPGWPAGNLYHGECAVRMLKRAEVLTLPHSERRKLTLADTGKDLMLALLDAKEPT